MSCRLYFPTPSANLIVTLLHRYSSAPGALFPIDSVPDCSPRNTNLHKSSHNVSYDAHKRQGSCGTKELGGAVLELLQRVRIRARSSSCHDCRGESSETVKRKEQKTTVGELNRWGRANGALWGGQQVKQGQAVIDLQELSRLVVVQRVPRLCMKCKLQSKATCPRHATSATVAASPILVRNTRCIREGMYSLWGGCIC